MDDFQIKGLEKLINSSVIKEIYPMVDRIEFRYDSDAPKKYRNHELIDIDIFLNDDSITRDNMYEKEFDPHYLVEHHIRRYSNYFNIKDVVMNFIVWGPDGSIITSYQN